MSIYFRWCSSRSSFGRNSFVNPHEQTRFRGVLTCCICHLNSTTCTPNTVIIKYQHVCKLQKYCKLEFIFFAGADDKHNHCLHVHFSCNFCEQLHRAQIIMAGHRTMSGQDTCNYLSGQNLGLAVILTGHRRPAAKFCPRTTSFYLSKN